MIYDGSNLTSTSHQKAWRARSHSGKFGRGRLTSGVVETARAQPLFDMGLQLIYDTILDAVIVKTRLPPRPVLNTNRHRNCAP